MSDHKQARRIIIALRNSYGALMAGTPVTGISPQWTLEQLNDAITLLSPQHSGWTTAGHPDALPEPEPIETLILRTVQDSKEILEGLARADETGVVSVEAVVKIAKLANAIKDQTCRHEGANSDRDMLMRDLNFISDMVDALLSEVE